MNTNIVTQRLAMADAPPHLAVWHGTRFAVPPAGIPTGAKELASPGLSPASAASAHG